MDDSRDKIVELSEMENSGSTNTLLLLSLTWKLRILNRKHHCIVP